MKQRSLIFLFVTILMLAFGAAEAQNMVLNGEVTDTDSTDPLIGATVMVKGTTRGTITDYNGQFTLEEMTIGDILVFSYTGYREKEITIRTSDFLVVDLGLDAQVFDEVVVIGYGKQRKKVATGSIAKITTDNIEGIVTSDVQSTLEGQVSGLIVNESSGQPGAGKSIFDSWS